MNGQVPFAVQEWLMESLADTMLEKLHSTIDEYRSHILCLAYDRWKAGYQTFGSEMYTYSEERRLENVLEELADCVAYLTSGPIRPSTCGTMGIVESIRRAGMG